MQDKAKRLSEGAASIWVAASSIDKQPEQGPVEPYKEKLNEPAPPPLTAPLVDLGDAASAAGDADVVVDAAAASSSAAVDSGDGDGGDSGGANTSASAGQWQVKE